MHVEGAVSEEIVRVRLGFGPFCCAQVVVCDEADPTFRDEFKVGFNLAEGLEMRTD